MMQANHKKRQTLHPITTILLLLLAVPLSSAALAQENVPTEVEATPEEMIWVDAFLKAFVDGKPDGDLIDQHRLIRTALKPFQLTPDQFKTFDNAPVGQQLVQGILNNAIGESVFTFLRVRELNGQRLALFHLRAEDGLTYYEWYLDADAAGKVRAWDCEAYVSGERMSQTLRRMWIPVVAEIDEQVRKHMGKANREFASNFQKIMQIRNAYASQEHEQAIKLYESLPQSVQDERTVMSVIMTSYLNAGDEDRHQKLLERYNALYSAASNRELMMIDLCIYREDYGEAMKMVDGLDRRVGGDPYLDVMRSNIVYLGGDYAKAKTFSDRGIENDPGIEDFYWGSIEQAIAEEDWPRISDMFDGLILIGVEINDLHNVDYFSGYVKSGAYDAWLKKQAQ